MTAQFPSTDHPKPAHATTHTQIIHKARRFLKRRGKLGLLAALDTMTQELMLLGVATLILLVVERNVIATCGEFFGWVEIGEKRVCWLTETKNNAQRGRPSSAGF